MKKYLTIDIGGSSVKYAVIDEALNLECPGTVEAPRKSLEQFVDCIGNLYDSCKDSVEGIEISLAATVNPQNGYILLAGVFPLDPLLGLCTRSRSRWKTMQTARPLRNFAPELCAVWRTELR